MPLSFGGLWGIDLATIIGRLRFDKARISVGLNQKKTGKPVYFARNQRESLAKHTKNE
jgi:hypothetical protein